MTKTVDSYRFISGVSRKLKSMHNLCFALGSVVKKPWVVQNKVEIRDILHLTVLFDDDMVDGAPAARFASRLVKHIQRGLMPVPASVSSDSRRG